MSKKVLSLVLALVMVLGTFGTAFAASYPDTDNTVYADAVDRLSEIGILKGYPDGSFKPEGQITRAEFAAVAVRAKGLDSAATAAKGLATGFTDVPTAHWASGYVGTAGRLGIINGVGGGLFAPEAPVKYEEAVTMIVRALGYEVAAQAKGGYPYGYLIVANEVGLLDAVKGTQGTPATRGTVAQITDNALEIEMMIQTGFGVATKWVVSGTEDTTEKYLLDELGFDSVTGRTTKVSSSKKNITVTVEDEDEQDRLGKKSVSIAVPAGFDIYEVEGVEAKFWYRDGLVISKVLEDAKFDAVEVDGDELTLVVEDENYDVDSKATLILNGEEVDQDKFNADYAKVVLNDDDEIIWAQGYTFDGFILVEEVKDEVALSYEDYDEVDLEDFLVIKEGKTLGIDGIEEQDLVFYNDDEEFAIVYNNGKEGELDRVYTNDTFRFEGSNYSYVDAVYFDNGEIGELTEAILDDFLDDEATITVFVDFYGNAVVVEGEVSSIGSSAYGVLLEDTQEFSGRKGAMIALELRNGANAKVSYDIVENDISKGDIKLTNLANVAAVRALTEGTVLKITVDKDGDVTGIELPENYTNANAFEIDDSTVKVGGVSYRLQSSTIVFHDDLDEATTLAKAKGVFDEVKAGSTIYVEKGKVIAVVGETDADADTKDVVGLVTGVKALTSGRLEFTLKVFGTTERYVTESKTLKLADYAGYKNTIRTFEVGETSGEIKGFKDTKQAVIEITSKSGRTINNVELNRNAKIYDKDLKEISLNDLKVGRDTITVYFEGSSARFVNYVVVGGTIVVELDKTALVAATAAANAKVEANYTAASWAVLKAALARPEATQAEVDAKTAAINAAIAKLVVAEEVEVTATATKGASALGVTEYTVKLEGADLKDITDVLVNGNSKKAMSELTGGVYSFRTDEAAVKIEVVVNGKTIEATIK